MVVGDRIIVVEHVAVGAGITAATTPSTSRAGGIAGPTCTVIRAAAAAAAAGVVVVDAVQACRRCRLTSGTQSPYAVAAADLLATRRGGNSRTLLVVLAVAYM